VSEAKFGEPIAYAPKRGLRTAEDMFIGDAWPAYRSRLVACYNAFAGVDDPESLMAAVREYCEAANLCIWVGNGDIPDGFIEAQIQSERALSRLRAAMSEVE